MYYVSHLHVCHNLLSNKLSFFLLNPNLTYDIFEFFCSKVFASIFSTFMVELLPFMSNFEYLQAAEEERVANELLAFQKAEEEERQMIISHW